MMFMGIVGQVSGSLDSNRDNNTLRDSVLGFLDPSDRVFYLASDHVPSESLERSVMAHEYGHATTPWSDESETIPIDWIDDEEALLAYWDSDDLESGSALNEITIKPPANAEFLLSCFVKGDELDAIFGDLTERHLRLFRRLGKRKADLHTYIDVARLLYHLGKRSLVKTSVMVVLGQWIRKLIS